MSLVKDSKWERHQEANSDNDDDRSSDEGFEDYSANLHEYARRDGPHEESESLQEKYNISEEESFDGADVYDGSDDDSSEQQVPVKHQTYQHHPYAGDSVDSDSYEQPQRQKSQVQSKHKKLASKSVKKIVYVYKQPPIIVKPKPTNVFIRSKPIIVQPPPLVVHHPQSKPCKPIIKYKPPNIKLRPVIVKISKPKPTRTTTTTTTCPTTTKKPRRKCKKAKTTKSSCNRCSRRKSLKTFHPEDLRAFLSNRQQPQFVQYKNMKFNEGILTWKLKFDS